MSEIKNDGLDRYGTVLCLNGIGGERVKQTSTVLTVTVAAGVGWLIVRFLVFCGIW